MIANRANTRARTNARFPRREGDERVIMTIQNSGVMHVVAVGKQEKKRIQSFSLFLVPLADGVSLAMKEEKEGKEIAIRRP